MKAPFSKEDHYLKEKRFAALFGGILLLVLLICLIILSAASPYVAGPTSLSSPSFKDDPSPNRHQQIHPQDERPLPNCERW